MLNDANKISHIDIVQNPDVVDFLNSCSFMREPTGDEIQDIISEFIEIDNLDESKLPDNIITIDSSSYEAQVRDDIPFTNIGYVKIVNSLLKNNEIVRLSGKKFVNPFAISKLTEEKESIVFVLPSSNVKYKDAETTEESFRLALDEYFEKTREKEDDRTTSLKSTLFWLSSYRKGVADKKLNLHKCPNSECCCTNLEVYNIEEEQYCPSCGKRIFATDSLRLHEEIDDDSPSNSGVLVRFQKAIRHIYLAHMLRILMLKNKSSYLSILKDLAFIINGPLAIAGTAAWVHGAIMKVINEINIQMREHGYKDLMIIGILNGGLAINDYANLIEKHISNSSLLCVSDDFRDKYINYNRKASGTTFGAETYYGQDFIWKNKQESLIVFNLPYPVGDKSNLAKFIKEKSNPGNYNNLHSTLQLLQVLRCDMDSNSLAPLVLSRQYTAISMEPGTKVLDLLSRNLIKT